MSSFKEEGKTEWDMRQAFLERLHNCILNCHQAIFRSNYEYWYKSLRVLKLELHSHIRGEEENKSVDDSFSKLTAALYQKRNNRGKFEVFINAQESLHEVMRARGFDISINERSPGSALRDN